MSQAVSSQPQAIRRLPTQSHSVSGMPIIGHLETLINTLRDPAQRDDAKHNALKEISDNFEELTSTSTYAALIGKLLEAFVKILDETTPQFVSENNTLQLRKLVLELLLRMGPTTEMVKSHAKNVYSLLLRIVASENEENAVIIFKILNDHIKAFRPSYCPEVSSFFGQWKNAYRDMPRHVAEGNMFHIRHPPPSCRALDDAVVEQVLHTCYCSQPIVVHPPQPEQPQEYNLIPKATQSAKVLAEIPMFLTVLIQLYRQHLFPEVADLVVVFIRYVNLKVPKESRSNSVYNKDLVDDFHNSQVRCISFMMYMSRQSPINELLSDNASGLCDGMMQLLNGFHGDVIAPRRDIIMALKYFFQSEMRSKLVELVPLLTNPAVLTGTSFTAQDHLRNHAASAVADILHHVRQSLPYEMIVHVCFLAAKNLHDPLLLPSVQTMYAKLLMNFAELLLAKDKEQDEPTRVVLLASVDAFVRKAKTIADYHLPLIMDKCRPVQSPSTQQSPAQSALGGTSATEKASAANEPTQTEGLDTPTEAANTGVAAQATSTSAGPVAADTTKQEKVAISPAEAAQPYWPVSMPPFSLTDCRNMVRYIVQPMKMLTLWLRTVHMTTDASPYDEGELYSKYFLHGLKCLDVFMIVTTPTSGGPVYQRNSAQGVRSKEEKETVEAFALAFTSLNPQVFYNILGSHMEFFVERIASNNFLQTIASAFLSNQQTSVKVGDVLVRYLLKRLPEMGASNDRAALHLRLFKLLFSAVTSQQATPESEEMLKPHLHEIVRDSMQLSLRGREPMNYFLLLRALFRSIGSGTHDLLYQQFLPLLPSILQQLNRLQNGSHRQPIHELFVELCLTVPVRLSSLLPYLPLLMDPLVCALYGTPSLVQQGLRTLELCVDNLQPEYLYEHMAPIRSALMQGLWRTIGSHDVPAAITAIRILGKFGGTNRKILVDAQTLDYVNESLEGPALTILFKRALATSTPTPTALAPASGSQKQGETADLLTVGLDAMGVTSGSRSSSSSMSAPSAPPDEIWADLPMERIVQTAVNILRAAQGNTEGSVVAATGLGATLPVDLFIGPAPKVQALEVVRSVITVAMASSKIASYTPEQLKAVLTKAIGNVERCSAESTKRRNYMCRSRKSRDVFKNALTGLFYAAVNSELRPHSLSFFKEVVRHFSVQAIIESAEENFPDDSDELCMDGAVLIDAVTATLADSCKDYCQAAIVALRFMKDTVTGLFGDWDKACQLPFFSFVLDEVADLCYQREWYARLGGCTALRFVLECFPRHYTVRNVTTILDALFEVISGLADEVSNGAMDMSSRALDYLLNVCFGTKDEAATDELSSSANSNSELLKLVVSRCVDHLTDSEAQLRNECYRSLATISRLTGRAELELLLLSSDAVVALLTEGMRTFSTLSLDRQMSTAHFYAHLKRLENKDASTTISSRLDHNKVFIENVATVVGVDDQLAAAMPSCQRLLASPHDATTFSQKLLPLRETCIEALLGFCLEAARRPADDTEMEIDSDVAPTSPDPTLACTVDLLLKNALVSGNPIQEQCISAVKEVVKATANAPKSAEDAASKILQRLADSNEPLEKDELKNLLFLAELSPCAPVASALEIVLNKLNKVIKADPAEPTADDVDVVATSLLLCVQMHHVDFQLLSDVLAYFAAVLSSAYLTSNGGWSSAVLKYSSLMTEQFVDYLISGQCLQKDAEFRLVCLLLKHVEAGAVREALMQKPEGLQSLARMEHQIGVSQPPGSQPTPDGKYVELRTMKLLYRLVKHDRKWFSTQSALCNELRHRWNSTSFRRDYGVRKQADEDPQMIPVKTLNPVVFKVPRLYAKIFLAYLRENMDDISLLFELSYVFCYTYATDFTFVRHFIDDEVIPNTSLPWKRSAFLKVIEMLKSDMSWRTSEQLVRFMQYIVAPSFTYAFEKYDTDDVVGSSADPEQANNEESIVWQMCTHVIEQEQGNQNAPPMSDALKILFYQFSVLLVQKCANHIHDTNRKSTTAKIDDKQQGTRLRQFMLFGWPCLQLTFKGDQTEKYSGQLLIANIIEKFAINRKIVLQVFNTLVRAHQQDHKEVVRKALDILIPAIPKRMDDGYLQLHTMIKKVVIEESHNTAQITHCLNIVVRHYKVFYNVRHALAQVILSSLQRLFTGQYSFETKRLVVDVCEMFIKWEQIRQKELETAATAPQLPQPQQAQVAGAGAEPPSLTGTASVAPAARSAMGAIDDTNRSLDKPVVDHVVTLLLKTSTLTVDTPSGSASAAAEQLSKRSIILLRLAMKPSVFGQVATIKSNWLERQLTVPTDAANTEQAAVTHHLNVAQATIDVLSSIIHHLPEQTTIEVFTPLQRALIGCMTASHHAQLQRAAFGVVAKLMEKATFSTRGLEKFEALNQFVQKHIQDAFTVAVGGTAQPIIMGITLLKTICNVQPAYLDNVCLQPFMRMLVRMVREYMVPMNTYGVTGAVHIDPKEKMLAEIIGYCLEMLRPRINAVSAEVRLTAVKHIIIPLIDKNAVDKIVEVIIRIAHELLSAPVQTANPIQQLAPCGMQLLLRMQQQMEARLHTNVELMRSFLSTVIVVFEDSQLNKLRETIEARARLQHAFFWGLSATEEPLRSRYFAVLESGFPQDVFQRLVCIMSKQNWQPMSHNYWVAHAARLLLSAAIGKRTASKTKATTSEDARQTARLRITNCATFGATHEKVVERLLETHQDAKDEASDAEPMETDATPDSVMTSEESSTANSEKTKPGAVEDGSDPKDDPISIVVERQLRLAAASTEEQYLKLANSLAELMHYDWPLAHAVWKKLFVTIWPQLSSDERDELGAIAQPFVASGIMLPQRDSPMSVVTCFVDTLLSCDPPIQFQPSLLRYVGMAQRCWHIALLALEKQAKSLRLTNEPSLLDRDNPSADKLAVLECLAELYAELNETDQYEMCWKRRVYFEQTSKCLVLYNQGEYTQCRKTLEELMSSTFERLSQSSPLDQLGHFAPPINTEVKHWEQQWVSTLKELNNWSTLMDFANTEEVSDPALLMDAAWHKSNWPLVRQCMIQVDACGNPVMHFKTSMYKVMNSLMNGYQSESKENVEKIFQDTSRFLISEWRKLPRVVSHSHLRLLRATHVVHEINEANTVAAEIHRGQTPTGLVLSQKLITEVKLVSKTWRNRAMTVIDPLSTWVELENWRVQHYQTTMQAMGTSEQMNPHTQQMFPMHSIAQTQFQLARNMRRCGQYQLAIEELNNLHRMTAVHPMDASLKVYEHVKCLLKMAGELKKRPAIDGGLTPKSVYMQAADIIDRFDMQLLTKDHVSKLLAIKAQLLSQMDNTEDANKTFTAAARLQENSASATQQVAQVWKYWGEHLERLFLENRSDVGALEYGTNAIACLLECARTTSEEKSRTYLSKLFWLLKVVSACGGEKATQAVDEVLMNYHANVPTSNWVFWLNAVVADIRQRDGLGMITVLRNVAEVHPQQTLVALRLVLEPKAVTDTIRRALEHLPLLSNWMAIAPNDDRTSADPDKESEAVNGEEPMDTATSSDWLRKPAYNPAERQDYSTAAADWRDKLSAIVELVSVTQPTDITCLNAILNEMDELTQNWTETKLCQLRYILEDCHKHLYAHINELVQTKVPETLLQATRQWLEHGPPEQPDGTHGKAIHALWSETTSMLGTLEADSLMKFAYVMRQCLRNLRALLGADMQCLKLRDASAYLANFDSKMAEIDVFSSTVCPKIAQYSACISRFLPVYRRMVRHSGVCRVLLVRSMNGKVYSYQLDRSRFDMAKAHISQMMTLLNTHLAKDRESARRFLCFPQPQVLHTGRYGRLMECCPIAGASSQMQNLNADRSHANFRPFIEILRQELGRESADRDPYDVIDSFYERVSALQASATGQRELKAILSEVFRAVITGNGHRTDLDHTPPSTSRPPTAASGQDDESQPRSADSSEDSALPAVTPVPTNLLTRWFHGRYPDPTTFWHIRKKMAVHLALLGVSEYVFSMTALDLEGLVVDLSTGQLFYTDFAFDIIRKFPEGADKPQLELECIRPVPFRLSSNIASFLGVSIEGHLCSSAIAAARCFHQRSVDAAIRPFLWDAFWKANGEHLSGDDTQFVDSVFRGLESVKKRIDGTSRIEDGVSPVTTLVSSALSPDNLCRMNPSWHPWF